MKDVRTKLILALSAMPQPLVHVDT